MVNEASQLLVATGATLLGTSFATLFVRGRKPALGQLLLAAGAFAAVYFLVPSGTSHLAHLRAAVGPPKLILFGPMAFGLSLIVLIYSERSRDRSLKARLMEVHSSLLYFAGEIGLREAEIESNGGVQSEGIEHGKWIATEFERKYNMRLIDLFKTLMRLGWFDEKTAVQLLQLPFRQESSLHAGRAKIGTIARFINEIANRPDRPRKWLARWSAWGNLLICLICSAGMWFALDFLAKHLTPT